MTDNGICDQPAQQPEKAEEKFGRFVQDKQQQQQAHCL
jgi:hypothetical protein